MRLPGGLGRVVLPVISLLTGLTGLWTGGITINLHFFDEVSQPAADGARKRGVARRTGSDERIVRPVRHDPSRDSEQLDTSLAARRAALVTAPELTEATAGAVHRGQSEDELYAASPRPAEMDAPAARGGCRHDGVFLPPFRVESLEPCTVEQELRPTISSGGRRYMRELRFYGDRTNLPVGSRIFLAVVPALTERFEYRWDLTYCDSAVRVGTNTGAVFEFVLSGTDSCDVRLHTGVGQFSLSYTATAR